MGSVPHGSVAAVPHCAPANRLAPHSETDQGDGGSEVSKFLNLVKIQSRARPKRFKRKGVPMRKYFAARRLLGTAISEEQFDSPREVAEYWISRVGWENEGFLLM